MSTEPHERLAEIRAAAGYETPTDAARAFGWNETTYRSHENGVRGIKSDTAVRYAKAFRSTAAFILTGQGEADSGLAKDEVLAALEVAFSAFCRSELAAKEAARALLSVLLNQKRPPVGLRRADQIRVLTHQLVEQFADQALLKRRP